MGKFIRWMAIGIALLAVVLVVIINVVDLNQFKPQIQDQVRAATGRELVIAGDIGLSFYPLIGVSLGETELANPPGFEQKAFAKIESVVIGVKLIPLFSKQVEIEKIVIDGLALTLHKKADATDNWSDLAGNQTEQPTESTTESAPTTNPLANLNIAGVLISNAAFQYQDDVTSQSVAISKLRVETGAVQLGQPLDLAIEFDFANKAPELKTHISFSGLVMADIENGLIKLEQSSLDVDATSAELGIKSALANMLWDAKLDLNAQRYELQRLKLNANINTAAVPEPLSIAFSAEPVIDLQKQQIIVNNMKLTANSMALTGNTTVTQLLDSPKVLFNLNANTANLKVLLASLGVVLPETRDEGVLKSFSMALQGEYTDAGVNLPTLNVKLDETDIRGNATVNIDQAPMKANATLQVNAFNVDRYLAPVPPDDGTQPVAATPPEKAEDADLFAWMDLIQVNAKLTMGELIASKIKLEQVKLGVVTTASTITASPVDAKIWGGQQAATVVVHRETPPRIEIKEKLNVSSIDTMLTQLLGKSFLDGIGDIELNASLAGMDMKSILKSLNAKGSLALADGSIPRINLSQEVRKAKAKFKGDTFSDTSPNRSEFSDFVSQFSIENGVLKMKEINLSNNEYSAKGTWNYNLAEDKINADLSFIFPESMKDKVSGDLKELVGIPLPINISGSVLSPSVKVDLKQAMKNIAKQAEDRLKSEVKAKVDDKADQFKEKASEKVNKELKKIDLKKLFK